MTPPLKQICQHCDLHFGGPVDAEETHGICQPCMKIHHPESWMTQIVNLPLVTRGIDWSEKTGLIESRVRRWDLLSAAAAILELLEDADSPALEQHVQRKIEQAFADAANDRAIAEDEQRMRDTR